MTELLALPGLHAAASDARAYAGPIGLVVVVLLGIATVLLIRNMDKRLKRLPTEFAPDELHPDARPDTRREPPTPPGGPGRA